MKKRWLLAVLTIAVLAITACAPDGKKVTKQTRKMEQSMENIETTQLSEEDWYMDGTDEFMVDNYTYLVFSDGDCGRTVTRDIRFASVAPPEMVIKWTSSDESVVTNEGKVTRQQKDKKVTITADIQYEGKNYQKEFPLTVKRKNTIDTDTLTDDSLEVIKPSRFTCEVALNDSGYVKNINGKYSDIEVDSWDTAMASLYNIKSLLGIGDISKELQINSTEYGANWGYIFTFNQRYKELPVCNGWVTVESEEDGTVSGLESSYFPISGEVDTSPKITGKEAAIKAEPAGYWKDPEEDGGILAVYNENGKGRLVWELSCDRLDDPDVVCRILVDAKTGEVVLSEEDWNEDYETSYKDIGPEELVSSPKENQVRVEDIKPDETIMAIRFENGAWGQQHYMLVVNKEGKCKFIDWGDEWIGDENLLSRMDECLADSSIPYAPNSFILQEEQLKVLLGTKDFALQKTGWGYDGGAMYYYVVNGSGKDRKLVCMQMDGNSEYRSRYQDVRELCDKMHAVYNNPFGWHVDNN